MAKNFPNLMENINLHIQEAQQKPIKIQRNTNLNTSETNCQKMETKNLESSKISYLISHQKSQMPQDKNILIVLWEGRMATKNSISGK